MHFEENQLSPSSIGISPLSTVHPPRFQPGSVRASTRSYPRFTLTMDRSLGFGSTPCDYHHHYGDHALFRLAFATAPGVNPLTSPHGSNSPAHSTKGTQSGIPVNGHSPLTACKHTVSGTFNSPSGVLFTFPSRYLFTIGHQEYSALDDGPPRFPQNSTCSVVLGSSLRRSFAFRVQGCHLLRPAFPMPFD